METQQLASKVTQLEARVATLEDEGKIVRGEVKQVLTEIRTAVLARDNPFDADRAPLAAPVVVTPPPAAQITLQQQPAPEPAPQPTPAARPHAVAAPEPAVDDEIEEAPSREPIMLRPRQEPPPPEQPQWSLLTIAGLAAWAEDAVRRLGSLRLEILLDLCEAAGHISPESRVALSRVTELDLAEPAQPPSTNETVVILRQLDALVNDEQDYSPMRAGARF